MPTEEFLIKVIKNRSFLKKAVKNKNESNVGEDLLIVSSQASEGNEDHQRSVSGSGEAGRQPDVFPCRALPRFAHL